MTAQTWIDIHNSNQLARLLEQNAIFFTVSFKNFYEDWREFDNGRYFTIEDAQESAKRNSLTRVDTLIKMHVGDIILQLWLNGECLFTDVRYNLFIGKDYSEKWK